MRSKLWTVEEEDILRELWLKDVAFSEIEKVLKSRTRIAIEDKVRHLGLKRPEVKPEIDEEYLGKLRKVIKF